MKIEQRIMMPSIPSRRCNDNQVALIAGLFGMNTAFLSA